MQFRSLLIHYTHWRLEMMYNNLFLQHKRLLRQALQHIQQSQSTKTSNITNTNPKSSKIS